ncbi:hypothetical protein [Curtobacterium sp. 314Chir4.1]|uniref:hypothetical protein n=1 Tax=Curtobacterium sp. 314Chir4.1 TaxID=1279028 RepID=UPI001145105F|nr:hypothetical protein [Curtobacterium sp. 314Chir4.1]
MMDSLDELITSEHPDLTLHVERFAATARDDSQNRPFQVFLAQAGETVDVPAGRPEHRDDICAGDGRNSTELMHPCVSRGKDPVLVLDA